MCVPKAPKTPPPPAPPKIPQAPQEVDQAVVNARARQRQKAAAAFGHNATVLTGGRGVMGMANTGVAKLFGDRSESKAAKEISNQANSAEKAKANNDGTVLGSVSPDQLKKLLKKGVGSFSGLGLGISGAGGVGSSGGSGGAAGSSGGGFYSGGYSGIAEKGTFQA